MTFGATMLSIEVPDRNGDRGNVILAHDTLAGYVNEPAPRSHMGGTLGRYAGRIAGAKIALDGKTFALDANDGGNTLHGGACGFDRVLWRVVERDDRHVTMEYDSADGEQGFPGALRALVRYSVIEGTLGIAYEARSDADTVINLSNHAYFNLRGEGEIGDHVLQIPADRYVPVDDQLIPTGALEAVDGTPFDFRSPRAVGLTKIDQNWIFEPGGEPMRLAAMLGDPHSARVLEIRTTQPALQVYTGRPSGIALETQHLPDSPHHAQFPSTLLRAGAIYRERTELRFTCKRA